MKVSYPKAGSQSGSSPTRNRAHSAKAGDKPPLLAWPWPGANSIWRPQPLALESCSGSAVSGSPSPQRSPPTGPRLQGSAPERLPAARDAEKGAHARPEGARAPAALTAAGKGAPGGRAAPAPRLQSALAAPRARTLTRAPPPPPSLPPLSPRGHRRSGPPPPLRASASGAALPDPAPGPPPRSPHRQEPPARLASGSGARPSPRAAGRADLGAAFRPPGLSPGARKRLRAHRPRAAVLGRRG